MADFFRISDSLRNQNGAVTLETGLVFGLLLVFLFGSVSTALILNQAIIFTDGVQAASREAAIYPGNCITTSQAAFGRYITQFPGVFNPTAGLSAVQVTMDGGTIAAVRVSLATTIPCPMCSIASLGTVAGLPFSASSISVLEDPNACL